jgi:hypothetical protein
MGGYANFDIAERIHEKVNLGQFHKWTPSVTDHNQNSAEKTYRAIGRFIFEFSQVEYTIRHYLAQEIRLDDQHFSAVVESYDVGVLCTVATEVFKKSRTEKNAAQIKDLIKKFRSLTDVRNRVAHGLWVPFKDGGTVHHVARTSLTSIPAANQAEALEELADEACKVRAELERAFSTFDI